MEKQKVALITGITGQDGSFLAELLIEKNYEVHGVLRRSSSFNTGRIEHLYLEEWVRDMKKERAINLHYGDMTDSSSLIRIIQTIQPDEIYNLAAQSHVKVSFDVPEYTAETDGVGTLRLRGETFVTRKITLAAARIAQGMQDKLYLGNLSAMRDWGYAKDYVQCMWMMLQHDTPEDFVIATGEMHSVREFCTVAFAEAGIELRWQGEGIDEKGICTKTNNVLVEVNPQYFRPSEVEQLLGDPTKAKTLLGWNPTQTSFEELVRIMVRHDMELVKS